MDKLVKMKGMFPYGAEQSEIRNKRVSNLLIQVFSRDF